MGTNKRYDAKRDANEQKIINALEAAFCSVVKINEKDVPDLLVGKSGQTYLLEVKSERGRLSAGQDEFVRTWRGGPAVVVRTVDEALQAVGLRSCAERPDG